MIRKYILMDIDGTLVNTKEQFYTSLGETLSHFGVEAEMTPELFGMSVNQALQALQVTNIAEAKEFWETRFAELCEQAPFFPGIPEAVEELCRDGRQLIVITSRSHCTADPMCLYSPLAPYICCCIAAEDTPRHKPNPDPILKALALYNIDPKDTIYIGDGYHDYMASRAAGVAFGFAGWNEDAVCHEEYANVFSKPAELQKLEAEEGIVHG